MHHRIRSDLVQKLVDLVAGPKVVIGAADAHHLGVGVGQFADDVPAEKTGAPGHQDLRAGEVHQATVPESRETSITIDFAGLDSGSVDLKAGPRRIS